MGIWTLEFDRNPNISASGRFNVGRTIPKHFYPTLVFMEIYDYDFTPGPKLLPFGGFEVAALLHLLPASEEDCNHHTQDSISISTLAGLDSGGWLRSTLMDYYDSPFKY